MENGAFCGANIISGGTAGTLSQRIWPNMARCVRVYVLARPTPPSDLMTARAARMWGASAGSPATFSAK